MLGKSDPWERRRPRWQHSGKAIAESRLAIRLIVGTKLLHCRDVAGPGGQHRRPPHHPTALKSGDKAIGFVIGTVIEQIRKVDEWRRLLQVDEGPRETASDLDI